MTRTTGSRTVRRVGRAGAAVTAGSILTNLLAYLVPMLGARHLSAAELSVLATVLALGAVAGVPGMGLQLAVAVHRARHGPTSTTRLTLLTTAVTTGFLVVVSPLIIGVLRLPVEFAALLTAMTVPVLLAGRWLGELQGAQRFVRLAAGLVLLAVGRYAGVIAGLLLGAGLVRSLLAGAVVAYLVLPLLAWLAAATAPPDPTAPPESTPQPESSGRPESTGQPESTGRPDSAVVPGQLAAPEQVAPSAPVVPEVRRVVTASSATLAMLAISYADLILARQLLPPEESGAYAVGSVLTKGAIWAPAVVTVLALPRLARGDRHTRSVALLLVAAFGGILVTASALAGELAIRLVGGAEYAHLAEDAPYFAAVGALYALAFLLVNAEVAAGGRRPAGPLWAGIAGVLLGGWFVAPHTFAGVLGTALTVAALTTALLGWRAARRRSAVREEPAVQA